MQQAPTDFLDWRKRYGTERACRVALERLRWPQGFVCPSCGHDRAYRLKYRHLHQCQGCRHQVSAIAGTIFENTNLPLTKWFAAMYLMAADKGGISAMRLSQMIGVSWPTARSMLRKLRVAMGDRDRGYDLQGLVELDDALVGGRRRGKRGRGAAGKTAVLFAVERRQKGAGYLAAKAVPRVDQQQVQAFSERLSAHATVRSDGLPALRALAHTHQHQPKNTPPELADEWLPMVHIVISNFKRFVLGTFHGVSSHYLQEYLDEFVFRFNRRSWQDQLPLRLLQAAIDHAPAPMRLKVF